MAITKCEGCDHVCIKYHQIDRHFSMLPDGKVIYSNRCMEPNCRCERARIKEVGTPAQAEESQRFARVVASILG